MIGRCFLLILFLFLFFLLFLSLEEEIDIPMIVTIELARHIVYNNLMHAIRMMG